MALKRKILSFAVAGIATLAVGATTAFAELGQFNKVTLYPDDNGYETADRKKDDDLDAVVNITSGLNGNFYITARVRDADDGTAATGAKYLYVNGKHPLTYLNGHGVEGLDYFLRLGLAKQNNVDKATVSGKWEP